GARQNPEVKVVVVREHDHRVRDHGSRSDERRHGVAVERHDKHALHTCDRAVQRWPFVSVVPPALPVCCALVRRTNRSHLLFDDCKAAWIPRRAFQRPVAEVDDEPARSVRRTTVQVVAAQVWLQYVLRLWVVMRNTSGFAWGECEANTIELRPLEGIVRVTG